MNRRGSINSPVTASYGSWRSPISSDVAASDSMWLFEPRFDGEILYWAEGRVSEGGRVCLVCRQPDGHKYDVIGPPFSARTRVHEYGGGSYAVAGGQVFFVNDRDQQIYVTSGNKQPKRITADHGSRYADLHIDHRRNRLICVHEDHSAGEGDPSAALVAIPFAGQGSPYVLSSDSDFYATPRLSPDGEQLAWLSWNHPDMPWTGAELRVARLNDSGLANSRVVAGGRGEAIFQPEWSPEGALYFVSDRTGWWNLYRHDGAETIPILPMMAEFGQPQWFFGLSTYDFDSADRLVCAYTTAGTWKFAFVNPHTGSFTPVDLPYQDISYVRARPGMAVFRAGAPDCAPAIVQLHLADLTTEVVKTAAPARPELARYFSVPQATEFPVSNDETGHAFYYPPANPDFLPPEGELPPVLIRVHGGPTAMSTNTLDYRVQYFTSRGFAVADINYRGSTGFGRQYRCALNGKWGVVDVEDCISLARHLVSAGLAGKSKILIAGGSSGGYTALCALARDRAFAAGASYFGVSDAAALCRDTHKFESHYLDWLIGPYPEAEEVYRQRSPVHLAGNISAPVIFFQGEEDAIVPPAQTELMVKTLHARGVPFAFLLFAGEQHGLRRAENIKRALDAELYFYASHLLRRELRF